MKGSFIPSVTSVAYAALDQSDVGLPVTFATAGMADFLEGVVVGGHALCLAVVAGLAFGYGLSFHVRYLFAISSLAVVALGAVLALLVLRMGKKGRFWFFCRVQG